jgi:hypothetical protein
MSELSFSTDRDMPFEEWFVFGKNLIRAQEQSLFVLGDWLNYGKIRYSDKKYSSRYAEALEVLPYEYQSLVNIAFICAHVAPAQRRMDVSHMLFAHHREVSGLSIEQQSMWLGKAVEGGWSAAEMRRQMRAAAELADKSKKGGDDGRKGKRFNLVKWVMQGTSWMRSAEKETPLEQWPLERKQAVMNDLRPAAELYRRLGGRL